MKSEGQSIRRDLKALLAEHRKIRGRIAGA